MLATVDIPTRLPVRTLSHTSISLLKRCPEKWRRKYIDGQYEPMGVPLLLGRTFGAAQTFSYGHQIEWSERATLEATVDEFADEWALATERDEWEWGDKKPGEVKDQGVALVRAYETTLAPLVTPVTVEREFQFQFAGCDWRVKGYLDLEADDGDVVDTKVLSKRMNEGSAHVDPQPGMYLLARRAEGNPAPRFRFHAMTKTKTIGADQVTTTRTDRQLDAIEDMILGAAVEISWRAENDQWSGAAPGGWWCGSKTCGYWSDCKWGGAR